MRALCVRALTLAGVLVIVMCLLGIILGATGFSDRTLRAVINEELRGLRVGLAQGIRDPQELERVLEVKRKELEEFHGLNTPWFVRLPKSIFSVVKLDLGEAKTARSFEGSSKISSIVLERLPNTAILMLTSFFLVAFLGVCAGAWLATHAGGRADKVISLFSSVSFAVPAWWIGILLILVFAVNLELFPTGGMYSVSSAQGGLIRFADLLKHAALPVFALVLVSIGPYLYTIRTMTLRIAQEDFVTWARARGFSEARIRWRYILRPSAPPIVTGLVLGLAGSFGGAILTETVFNWPGMGRLYYEAIVGTPDEGLIVALTFIYTLIYIAARFILDVLYLGLDPRIRY